MEALCDGAASAAAHGTKKRLRVITPRAVPRATRGFTMNLIVPPDCASPRARLSTGSALRRESVLLSRYDPGRDVEDILVSWLVSPEDRPKIERHVVSRGIIKSLISMKVGISLVLESDTGGSFPSLIFCELRDGTGPSRFEYSAYR